MQIMRKMISVKKDNFRDRMAHIKESIDVHYLLNSLGFSVERETPKEIRCQCPVHGGDNRTAFRLNKDTKTWVCFTQKCHEIYGNDLIGLVKAVTKKDFIGALDYLKEFVPDFNDSDYIKSKHQREIDSFIRSYGERNCKPKEINEDSLASFKSLRTDYFLKQGFSKETLDYFEIAGGWVDLENVPREIIPIRSDMSELVAYSLRDIRPKVDSEDFKYILTPGFDKQNCLYNLHNAKEYADSLPIIVVEGFKSVWRLHELGIKNVVAVMGSSLTEGQQFLLCMYALKGVVVMFDNDMAGAKGIEKACKDLSGKLDVFPLYIQERNKDGKGLDPSDLTEEQLYEYLKTYYKKEI